MSDPINHPEHYTSHPSGVEVIRIAEHENFCLGNAIKYILRCRLKGRHVEDLQKARWYIDREIARLGTPRAERDGDDALSKLFPCPVMPADLRITTQPEE